MKRLIINADDFGLTEGVCAGIVESIHTGAVSSRPPRDHTQRLIATGALELICGVSEEHVEAVNDP